MRPGQQQNKQQQRMRGRGRKNVNPLSRSYESNGPDVKIRGNAQHIAEKYIQLARDATASGDRVMAENYLQHAEHYGRIVAAAQGSFQLQREEPDGLDGDFDETDDESFGETGATNGHPYPVPERADRPQAAQPNPPRDNRDFNREPRENFQNRENVQRDRDFQGRDNQARDNRDFQNRDPQQGRDFQSRDRDQNRGGNDFNRGDRNDRNFNRDRNERFNRDDRRDRPNRFNNAEERRPWEGRGDRQNAGFEPRANNAERPAGERSVPNGLGPQPVVGDLPPPAASAEGHQNDVRQTFEPRREEPRETVASVASQPAVTAAEPVAPPPAAPVTAQESGFGEAGAPVAALAEPEGAMLPANAERDTGLTASEPRRRGRPRRPRFGEEAADAPRAAVTETAADEAPRAAERPETPAAPVAAGAAEEAAPAKRRPGRPRKKRPEDEAGDVDTGHLPDFLIASNG